LILSSRHCHWEVAIANEQKQQQGSYCIPIAYPHPVWGNLVSSPRPCIWRLIMKRDTNLLFFHLNYLLLSQLIL
jgi:hypothetical protein